MVTALELQLEQHLDEQDAPTEPGFVIDTLEKAEWAMRKIAWYVRKNREVQELAARRVLQIESWAQKETENIADQIAFFESLLQPWAERELAESKRRSIKLPQGTLGFRKSQPKFDRDEDKLLPWVKDNKPEHLVVRESVDWAGLKKRLTVANGIAITEEGEVVPGVTVTRVPDKFYVKPEVE